MSEDSAPLAAHIHTAAPELALATFPPRRPPAKRNANPKAKRSPPRRRNAGPSAPRTRAPAPPAEPPVTKKEAFVHLVETLGGAAVTSLVGAMAVKWGLHPELVSAGLGGMGGYTAWISDKQRSRYVALGAASAAGSQLLLMKMNPAPAPKPATPIALQLPAPAPTHVTPPPRTKNADLGSLPPGMLDAAFERARAELAIAGDGYPDGYDHHHHGSFKP